MTMGMKISVTLVSAVTLIALPFIVVFIALVRRFYRRRNQAQRIHRLITAQERARQRAAEVHRINQIRDATKDTNVTEIGE